MNKKLLFTFLMLFTIALSVSAISASDVSVTDSYTTSLVDDTSDVSVPLENSADSSNLSVSSDSNVDNDPSKVSLSSEEVLESEDSNTLSTNNSDSNVLSSSDDGSTVLSSEEPGADSSSIVSKTITANDVTKYYKGSTQYTATFLDANGNPLVNASVQVTVNGVTHTLTTDSKGVASLAINLKPGTYKVTAVNPETGYSLTTTFKILSTITSSDINKVYTDGRKFTATFYKSDGKVLANKYIKFKLNGRTYKVKTNSKGVASLSISSLAVGTHKIISYNADGLTVTNTIKVVRSTTTSITTKNYLFLKSKSKYVYAKLLNKFGYAPGKGKLITFKINGKSYSGYTNANGVAKVRLPSSLKVGTYTVSYRFAGNNFYKASSGTSKVTIISSMYPTLTVKSGSTFGYGAKTPFKVLLTSAGTPIPNQVIKMHINGKTYDRVTNAYGIASIPINIPVGTYKITFENKAVSGKLVSKSGSTTITVKERTPAKLTWKSGTSFTQGSQTIKVLLQNSNSKALSGKSVKLTINSKTYTATTDSNGYAKFNVVLSKGNFTASFSYAATGDNDNAPASGSQLISVVKGASAKTGFGYWLFGANMKNADLNELASKGTTDIFLNYYAITTHGKSAVQSWIAKANGLGIRVHIWMQTFYDGGWINPVSNGKPNTAYFNQVINEALGYAKISGVAGIHFDYMRYPGNAYETSGGTAAITQFIKQASQTLHNYNPDLIVSCALMPETSVNAHYYGQDMEQISKYADVVVPMIYKGNYGQETPWIKTTTKWFVDHSNGAKVWGGLQAYHSDTNTAKLSLSEITKDSQAVLDGNGAGVILFRWQLSNHVTFSSLTVSSAALASTSDVETEDEPTSGSSTSSGSTTTSGKISVSNIITGSKNLKNYIESKGELPNTVTAGGVTFKLPEFLYLMSQAIYQLGNSNTKDISYILGVAGPSAPSGDSANMQVTKDDYITWAHNVANFIVEYKQAPNYATVSGKKIIYSEVVDAFSRILAFYGNNDNYMPNYVTVTTGSSSTGGASVTGNGLNQVNTETSLSKYLQATTNCQVNDATIKAKAAELTSGLTTELAKAKAIFNYVRDYVSYSFYYNTKYGAVNTLKYKTGNCVDQAHLVVALSRAAGLEARYVLGTCVFSSGSTYGHVWAQVLVGNQWYVADATSTRNSFGVVNNWNTNSFSLHGTYVSLSF